MLVQSFFERVLACVTKWRVPKVMRITGCLHEIRIRRQDHVRPLQLPYRGCEEGSQSLGRAPAELSHLQSMREPIVKQTGFASGDDLRFPGKPQQCAGIQNSVAVSSRSRCEDPDRSAYGVSLSASQCRVLCNTRAAEPAFLMQPQGTPTFPPPRLYAPTSCHVVHLSIRSTSGALLPKIRQAIPLYGQRREPKIDQLVERLEKVRPTVLEVHVIRHAWKGPLSASSMNAPNRCRGKTRWVSAEDVASSNVMTASRRASSWAERPPAAQQPLPARRREDSSLVSLHVSIVSNIIDSDKPHRAHPNEGINHNSILERASDSTSRNRSRVIARGRSMCGRQSTARDCHRSEDNSGLRLMTSWRRRPDA